jgi:outer membrane biogenesis lipoprotein LolB
MKPAFLVSLRSIAVVGLSVMLLACTEKPQQGTSVKGHDEAAWQGSHQPVFNAPGWKAADQTAWDNQLRARAQNQNEYLRTGGQK